MTELNIIDHIANIPCNNPEQKNNVFAVIKTLHGLGYMWSAWTVNAAIETHNHRLLKWLFTNGCPMMFDAAWVAVHSRNAVALRYVKLRAEHFDQVASENDTRFLGRMWQSITALERIDMRYLIGRRRASIPNHGDRWLARHHLIFRV